MWAPTRAAASATWRVPRALTAKASVDLGLAEVDRGEGAAVEHEVGPEATANVCQHGVAVVDAHGVDVGGQHLVVEARAGAPRARAARSGARRRAPAPPGHRRRSRPSCPSAPVIRIRTAQRVSGVPRTPSATGARARRGSHQSRWAAYQATVSARPCSQSIDGAQPSSRAQLRGVEHVAAVVAGAVGDDRLERLRLARARPGSGRRPP